MDKNKVRNLLILDVARGLSTITISIGLLNFILMTINEPSFNRFLAFNMTIPAAICVTLNGIAIFCIASFLKTLSYQKVDK